MAAQSDNNQKVRLEEGRLLSLRYNSDGLVPVVTTCRKTGTVLMQAWMNEDAFMRTLETEEAHYYSRSRQCLWHKGATSGQVQKIVDIRIDCDQDSLWLIVDQSGDGCCHTGRSNCFYRRIERPQGHDGSITLAFVE